MDAIERLTAIDEIKQLKARYWRACDTKDFELLETIFAPNASFDMNEAAFDPVKGHMPGTAGNFILEGRDMILALLPMTLSPTMQSVHVGYLPEVEITSDHTATAIFPFNDKILNPGIMEYDGFGYYYDTFVKIDRQWRVETSRIKRTRLIF